MGKAIRNRTSRKISLSKVYMDDEIKRAVLDVLDSGWYILGENVRKFEKAFADFCTSKFGICVGSGTAAIFLSLLSLGVRGGDEVIVPSFTAFPTVSPILHVGATPVFVEIDPETYTLNPQKIEDKITDKTKGIITVHLYGHPADIDPIKDITEDHDVFLIEDACQAHGALYKGKKVGSIGDFGCFSFYPSKNMTVCGDGGIVVTDNEEFADKIRMLRNHGRKEKYRHELLGYNLRFNEIQAAIGIKQLEKLTDFNEKRRRNAEFYSDLLMDAPLILPKEKEWAYHVYYMYVIRTSRRDKLRQWLGAYNISAEIHYPTPAHLQPAIRKHITPPSDLELTEKYCEQVLSLPLHPQQDREELELIARKIKRFFNSYKLNLSEKT